MHIDIIINVSEKQRFYRLCLTLFISNNIKMLEQLFKLPKGHYVQLVIAKF